MAQINLLKQNTSNRNWGGLILSLGVKILAVVLLAVVGYYAWLYFQTGSYQKKSTDLNVQIEDAKKSMSATPEKQELFTRQDQANQLDTLVKNHVYWSNFFPVLANSTLKSAVYDNINVTADGVLVMSVEVPTMQDLEKYFLVFDLPQFNKYFSNVHLSSVTQSQSKDVVTVKADIKMNFDPHLLSYGAGTATSTK